MTQVPRWVIAVVMVGVIFVALGWVVWRYRQLTAPSPLPPHDVGPPMFLQKQLQPSPPSPR
ncbi:hypothetical protein HRbin17_00616 [bacterium HR17]|uniref:Uncharacterized protein n=1 Tax=Candidatus Fervidibacter japonicus TaxID=2035412 RepID=A0A2H5XAA9_9BACT|nr:hypothetical protein HRbin17_00616 [bacterium HR17]